MPRLRGVLAMLFSLSFVTSALAATGAQKSRKEIDPKYQWNLSDVYPSVSAWRSDCASVKEEGHALAKFEGKILTSPETLEAFLVAYEKLDAKVDRISRYTTLLFSQDANDPESNALMGESHVVSAAFSSDTAFYASELSKLTESQLSGFLSKNPKLEKYKTFLTGFIGSTENSLPKDQEKLLAKADGVFGSPAEIYFHLSSDLDFPTIRDEKGQSVAVTQANYLLLRESQNRKVRKDSYEGILKTYQKVQGTMGAILNTLASAQNFFRTIHNQPSSLEAAVGPRMVPVYNTLIETVHDGLPTLHRYYDLRKRILGYQEIHPYDMWVPLVPTYKMTFPYDQAKGILVDALAPLGDDYGNVLAKCFTPGWIDVYGNAGKRIGAYSSSVYGIHPYVLINYTGNYRSLSVLSHEIGHSVNTCLNEKDNSFLSSGFSSPVTAEVASQVNELLLMDYMINHASNNKQKLYFLCEYANGILKTIFTRTQLAEFEKVIHEHSDAGEPLTAQYLNETWRKLSQQYYGSGVRLDALNDVEWAQDYHLYSCFYLYGYPTSYAASLAIEDRILREGKPAVDSYMRFLRARASDHPLDLLKEAGVDLTSPSPVKAVLAKFDRIVAEIDRLSGEIQVKRSKEK
ncbi:MAG TPA: oligoendopeptidase F [Cyanobacteria bacterium UBA8530]|nr:oligoendopeptidase F [Cyanobacteria bacterium UBA8530]